MTNSILQAKLDAANAAFESHDFGTTGVVDHEGWDTSDMTDFIKTVFVVDSDTPEADSDKVSFHVVFNGEDSPQVLEAYALDCDNGEIIGEEPVALPFVLSAIDHYKLVMNLQHIKNTIYQFKDIEEKADIVWSYYYREAYLKGLKQVPYGYNEYSYIFEEDSVLVFSDHSDIIQDRFPLSWLCLDHNAFMVEICAKIEAELEIKKQEELAQLNRLLLTYGVPPEFKP